MLEFVLNLFFPPVCGVCGKLNKNWLCEKCKNDLYSKKISNVKNCYEKNFDELLYLFKYKDIRELILKYKFSDSAYLSNMFSNIILDDEKIINKIKDLDMIIPVPMTKKKRANRGYNQTELIAKKIAENLNIEYRANYLLKIKNNKTQSSLNEKERLENIKNVFSVNDGKNICGKNVILFDDIVTTGATVDECSRVLKQNGAGKIYILALAKD